MHSIHKKPTANTESRSAPITENTTNYRNALQTEKTQANSETRCKNTAKYKDVLQIHKTTKDRNVLPIEKTQPNIVMQLQKHN